MKYISTLNKWLESEEEAKRKSILKEWARELLNKTELDAVICGHNHNPQVESFKGGTYLNPGFYGKHHTLGRYTKHNFELVTWDVSVNKIVPYT